MSTLFRIIALPLTLIAVLFVAACDTTPQVASICPKVRPLEQGGYLTRFLPGPGRDITDITLEAEFYGIAGTCKAYDDYIDVAVVVELQATKGPASEAASEPVDLIIIVLTADKKVLQRRALPVTFNFPDNQSTIKYLERFAIKIPKLETQNGDAFLIYTSFKLTPEELRFNREEKSF